MKKQNAITYLRVLAMVMVMFYHCICSYGIWGGRFAAGIEVHFWNVFSIVLSSVHVPLFLLISGFLYTYKRKKGAYSDTREYLYKRFLRIGVPYIFWATFFALTGIYSWNKFFLGMAHLWFLMVLLECSIIGRILDCCWKNERRAFVVGLLIVPYLLYVPRMVYYEETLCIGTCVRYLPYYLVGCSLGVYDIYGVKANKNLLQIVLFFISFIMLLFANLYPLIMYRPLIVTIFMSTLLYLGFLYIDRSNSWVLRIADSSMGMYILHQPLIQIIGLIPVMSSLRYNHYYIYPIAMFIFVFCVTFILTYFLNRIKFFNLLLG